MVHSARCVASSNDLIDPHRHTALPKPNTPKPQDVPSQRDTSIDTQMQLKNLFLELLVSLKLRNGRGFLSRSNRDNSDYIGEPPLPEELLITIFLSPAEIIICRRVRRYCYFSARC